MFLFDILILRSFIVVLLVMASFKCLSELISMKAGDKVDEIVVVMRGLESLTNGFVFGLWDELMV